MKLLIVDDMKSFLDLERTFLRRADCHVYTAATGLEAIKVAQTVHPDLVMLDIEMPEMNGIEATRIFSSTPSLQKIPVVVCSSLPKKEEALNAGAVEFIQKPVEEDQFLEVIQRYVSLKVRGDSRRTLEAPCTIVINGLAVACTLADISVSGALVRTDQPLKVGDHMAMHFTIPMENGKKEIQAEAIAVRTTARGWGIGFSDISEGAKLFIQEFIGAET
jgi:CheY-like chemotaxis protein